MKRSCGVLLPVSALPSKYGIGTFGRAAYEFVHFLKNGGQTYWQILPLTPTSFGDSPYQSFSTFAGNPYFIDLETLVGAGLLKKEECDAVTWCDSDNQIDYDKLYSNRFALLHKAFCRSNHGADTDFQHFKGCNEDWLEDYALFMALKNHFDEKAWQEWDDDIKSRRPEAMACYKEKLAERTEFWKYTQYLFFTQFKKLKAYANGNGIKIIGDMPICVAQDSADFWANTKLFALDGSFIPVSVAGVPPDYFSRTGQLWGNPLYDWAGHRQELFAWWQLRLAASFELYDVVRIDHFRAFDEYYAIPFGEKTAINGKWEKGPGIGFFDYMKERLGNLEIIAEDLGVTTDTVKELLQKTGYPGMRVLQFGFIVDSDSLNLPRNYIENSVAYTGTHDNDTLVGWYQSANEQDRAFSFDYLGVSSLDQFAAQAIRALYESVAGLAVVPIQDWLGLDNRARMNTPSTLGNNWQWRLRAADLSPALSTRMNRMAVAYRRKALLQSGESRTPLTLQQLK
jgi:4-alpha-glucanotransferase